MSKIKELCPYSKIIAYFLDCIPKISPLFGDLRIAPSRMYFGNPDDAAVLEAYGFPKDATESDIVARLFKMYQELTQGNQR